MSRLPTLVLSLVCCHSLLAACDGAPATRRDVAEVADIADAAEGEGEGDPGGEGEGDIVDCAGAPCDAILGTAVLAEGFEVVTSTPMLSSMTVIGFVDFVGGSHHAYGIDDVSLAGLKMLEWPADGRVTTLDIESIVPSGVVDATLSTFLASPRDDQTSNASYGTPCAGYITPDGGGGVVAMNGLGGDWRTDAPGNFAVDSLQGTNYLISAMGRASFARPGLYELAAFDDTGPAAVFPDEIVRSTYLAVTADEVVVAGGVTADLDDQLFTFPGDALTSARSAGHPLALSGPVAVDHLFGLTSFGEHVAATRSDGSAEGRWHRIDDLAIVDGAVDVDHPTTILSTPNAGTSIRYVTHHRFNLVVVIEDVNGRRALEIARE